MDSKLGRPNRGLSDFSPLLVGQSTIKRQLEIGQKILGLYHCIQRFSYALWVYHSPCTQGYRDRKNPAINLAFLGPDFARASRCIQWKDWPRFAWYAGQFVMKRGDQYASNPEFTKQRQSDNDLARKIVFGKYHEMASSAHSGNTRYQSSAIV